MGRAALGWNGKQLAEAAGVGSATVARFELAKPGDKPVSAVTVAKMQAAMEAAGVVFEQKASRLVVSVPIDS